ncbi:MAG TPA: XdhC family protein [Dongiaceae bacterium]|jgi:xanthine dehydrogenase accessory factor|nr:XdhC family protein [Dongiaceae bacterium]
MKASDLERLVAARAERRALALVTDLGTHQQALFETDAPSLNLSAVQKSAIATALAEDKSGEIEIEGRCLFVQARVPDPRLVIVGAVHITQALAPMAALAGYEVIVVDPRRAFATTERFPGMTLLHDWPDEALDAIKLDARCAVVTLTHDPKLDDPALDRALRSPAFYIGSLGSKKTHAARLQRLSDAGFDEAALARIHGPAGLAIGAKSPAEIAVSVLAQLTAARHGQQSQ